MAISFVSSSRAVASQTTSITGARPSGVQEGDVLVAFIFFDGSSGVSSPPSGWTLVDGWASLGRQPSAFSKVAGASETTDYTFTGGTFGAVQHEIFILAFRGVDATSPVFGFSDAPGTNEVPSEDLPSGLQGASVYFCAVADTGMSLSAHASGYTGVYSGDTSTDALMGGIGYKVFAAGSASTGALAPTFTAGSTNTFYGWQLVLQESNTVPTVAASDPTDEAVLDDTTPDLSVLVTDADDGQTLTTSFQVSTSSGFASIFAEGDAATSTSPQAGLETTWTVDTAVSKNTTYYWRARTSDGITNSDWSETRSFIVYDNPTCTITAPANGGTISTGSGSTTTRTRRPTTTRGS